MAITKIEQMTEKKLKSEIVEYDSIINQTKCYGTRDLIYYNALLIEAEQRGIEFTTCIRFS